MNGRNVMNLIRRAVRRIFAGRMEQPAADAEELRLAFKARYHNFKLLLSANNQALETMAEMEEALKGLRPFGITFVSSRCTRVSTKVWQIIKNLNDLAPGKYGELFERFKEIQQKINPFVRRDISVWEGPMVLSLDQVDRDSADAVGSKMANLGEIRNKVDLRVSNGFAVTAAGYRRFMVHADLQVEIDRLIQATEVDRLDRLYALSASVQKLIMDADMPDDLEAAMKEGYRGLEARDGPGVSVAMRSSALGEDVAGTSFAGQYRSVLNVSGENLIQVYKEIVASKYSPQAMTYRLNRGIRDEDAAMCVGCMSMVDAMSGGVVYSRNPVHARDEAVIINSVWGLPKSVVDGSTATDLFIVSRGEPLAIVRRDIPCKGQKFVCYPEEGVCRMEDVGEEGASASLTDEQVLKIARIALQIEDYYGTPQDIEWALDPEGSIALLQCRPLRRIGEEENLRLAAEATRPSEPVLLKGGFAASPGAGAGPVWIVRKDMDLLSFPEGGVLVAEQALPRWAAVLSRAAAVVTETGSVAGHLANVAREFGIPGIFGLPDAAARLRNDQIVTVDAEGLRVHEGRVVALLAKGGPKKNLMEGSPVFKALQGASRHIIPLNLLDPTVPAFSPSNCRTFHDITRFCHEKVVDEMFRFGRDHHFPERSSKQLHAEMPMQWWVLNLDDGFRDEVEGKYVHLDNIQSIPMLAVWEGITARPWGGPPPLDGKGFMSVMFQATANTALVPGVRTHYGDRNYFMISKNYCSLTSRLGFHFSTIEALVSERSMENYISFQFKGGAADLGRKHGRVLLVKGILEEYGFRVNVKEDNLLARMEGHDEGYMKVRLKVLGYLTIHTRQLDMIMANEVSVAYYREKLSQEIQALAPPSPGEPG